MKKTVASKLPLYTVYNSILFLLSFCLFTGCKKYLDEKPNKSDIIPTTLSDLQSLLNNTRDLNGRSGASYAELIADNYYVTTSSWQTLQSSEINRVQAENYIWGNLSYDAFWSNLYTPVYYANIILDELPEIEISADEEETYNTIKGSALFHRSFAFLCLAQLYCKPYAHENADEVGIIVRITSNVSEINVRSTVQQTYDRIITDLKEAADLLPATSVFVTQPTKGAAYAALARTYLIMGDYVNAGQYATFALQQKSTLIDYNSLLPLGSPPVSSLNQEVIFHNYSSVTPSILNTSNHKIDSTLYQSYNTNDLRKTVFFKANTGANAGTWFFQGSYNGTVAPNNVFDGLAVDELYLIRAECYARAGDKDAAMADLNTLMVKRWKSTAWAPFTAADESEALTKVLTERRKELLFRGQRWSDIRRFNVAGAGITLKRIIAGTTYTLPPNDLRSVMLLSLNEIKNNPAIEQNER